MSSKDVPKDVRVYRTHEYWEERYQKESDTTYDWLKTYKDLQPYFSKVIPDKNMSILMLGCGNSTLGDDMYDDGYHHITNVDYSSNVIKSMSEKSKDKVNMKWLEMDIRDMKAFENESFDVVLDKATMDTFFSGADVWSPAENVLSDVKQEVDEVVRILKVGGVFIYISFGQPHFRRQYITRENWDEIKVTTIGEFFGYFIYEMKKIK
ncbi:hypothetical protein PPL_07347 [Heterostelium album PN500]|uniref:Methyltransferase domain-containing protein n=1 Tax=Heterostelium pallidum (strain ATCC 26659 / Pp 5 / PN500) TaxID=670386 RepID=D3BF30_HETP5|nr:hypothetical protein PPL_07347 [Heterostelium album PN500]EFA80511.1 hypothetical protein PPL_07347 [Heterostelium album PN500]|eukprot:XP_020432631.1 hypothetical protein PPL_07347 [Heterostelium album PN500]